METYRFIFNGEIKSDCRSEQVMTHLASCFGVSKESVQPIFSGQRSFVKNSLNQDVAQQYVSLFDSMGAVSYVEAEGHSLETDPVMMQCPECLKLQRQAAKCLHCGAISEQQDSQEGTETGVKHSSSGSYNHHLNIARKKFTENKKSDRTAASVQFSISIGVTLLAIAFLLDGILSSGIFDVRFLLTGSAGAIDIGYWPYISGLIFFAHAGVNYAIGKGYPGLLGGVLGFTGFGLALLAILPDRNDDEARFELNKKSLVAIGIFVCGLIWSFSSNFGHVEVHDYLKKIESAQQQYHYYPYEFEIDEIELQAMHEDTLKLVNDGLYLFKNFDLRVSQEQQLYSAIYELISKQMMTINTQLLYAVQKESYKPIFFQDDHLEELLTDFRDVFKSAVSDSESYNLTMLYNNGRKDYTDDVNHVISQLSRLEMFVHQVQGNRRVKLEIQKQRKKQNSQQAGDYLYVDGAWQFVASEPADGFEQADGSQWADGAEQDDLLIALTEILESYRVPKEFESVIELDQGIMQIRLSDDLEPGLAGKTLIVGYYTYKYERSGQTKKFTTFTRIGGDLSDAYINGRYSSLFHWPPDYDTY